MEKTYNKLVRDNIPDIIKNNGEEPIISVLDDIEYKKELEKKLFEEYNEVLVATGEDRIEELADMLEIIRNLAILENRTLDDVIKKADIKNQKRGSFKKKIYLKRVISDKD